MRLLKESSGNRGRVPACAVCLGVSGYVVDCKLRKANCLFFYSYHPYLFFNQDKTTITFVGFNVNIEGDLIDPVSGRVIEKALMNPVLYNGLKRNGVNLSENHQHWDKRTMIEKMRMVMGLGHANDPDPSYVLTVDNVIKILAIQMRFR